MAECELLTADKVAAENRLSLLPQRANNRHDFCVATRLRLTLYTTLDRCDRAVDVFLEWLRSQGTEWSNRPTRDDVLREYERIWALLGSRQIEDLMDLPLVVDPEVLDTLDVFTEIVTPSILFDEHFSTLVVCRLVTLSLEHGNSDAACFAYVWLAMFAGPRLGNYKDGFRFGQLGYDLVEKRGLTRYQARTYMSVGAMVMPWSEHVASGRELVRRAFDVAYRIGDLTFASYSWDQLITICLAVGDPLAEVQTECENGLAFAKRVRFGLGHPPLRSTAGPDSDATWSDANAWASRSRRLHRDGCRARSCQQSEFGIRRVLLLDPQGAGTCLCRRLYFRG